MQRHATDSLDIKVDLESAPQPSQLLEHVGVLGLIGDLEGPQRVKVAGLGLPRAEAAGQFGLCGHIGHRFEEQVERLFIGIFRGGVALGVAIDQVGHVGLNQLGEFPGVLLTQRVEGQLRGEADRRVVALDKCVRIGGGPNRLDTGGEVGIGKCCEIELKRGVLLGVIEGPAAEDLGVLDEESFEFGEQLLVDTITEGESGGRLIGLLLRRAGHFSLELGKRLLAVSRRLGLSVDADSQIDASGKVEGDATLEGANVGEFDPHVNDVRLAAHVAIASAEHQSFGRPKFQPRQSRANGGGDQADHPRVGGRGGLQIEIPKILAELLILWVGLGVTRSSLDGEREVGVQATCGRRKHA